MSQKKWMIVAFFFVLILGVLVGRYLFSASPSSDSAAKPKVLYWVAPMNPSYKRDKPGKSPMGMDLVPVYADGAAGGDKGGVKISPVTENNLGVKVAEVKKKTLSRVIDTVGYVVADENRIEHIHTFTDGWIKVLNIKAKGDPVKQGDLLYKLYSPSLVSAQSEFLLAVKNKNSALMDAGRKKLLTLGMSKKQINQLQQSKKLIQNISVYSPINGIISDLKVRTGIYVKPAMDTMTIEDLSQIWVIAEVYERQASWVQPGQPTIASFPYLPGKVWQGNVDYVYPELNAKTHTLQVRLVFPNPDLTIKPSMYANIKIFSHQIKDVVAIPRSAVIRTEEGAHVIRALGNGRFKPVPVKLGIESGDDYQVLSGLNAGEKVVTQAQFLIDSEASASESLKRMEPKTNAMKPHGPQEYIGTGVIQAIHRAKHQLVLQHEPIPALDMPAMSMTLTVDDKLSLQPYRKGDKVTFKMIRQANGVYRLVQINQATARK